MEMDRAEIAPQWRQWRFVRSFAELFYLISHMETFGKWHQKRHSRHSASSDPSRQPFLACR
jgi:hypothetical protein